MKYVLFLTLTLSPTLLVACGGQPTARSTVESFCTDLSAGRWEKAFATFGTESDLKQGLAELEKEPATKELVGALLGSADCKVTAVKDNTVTVEMNTVDGDAVMQKVMAESMGLAMTAALGGEGGQKAVEAAILSKMKEGFSSQSAPRSETSVDVAMEEKGGRWVPTAKGNDLFGSALVGGLDNLGE